MKNLSSVRGIGNVEDGNQVVLLNRGGFIEKMRVEKIFEDVWRVSQLRGFWRKSILGRMISWSKGFKVGVCLLCLRNGKEVGVVGMGSIKG